MNCPHCRDGWYGCGNGRYHCVVCAKLIDTDDPVGFTQWGNFCDVCGDFWCADEKLPWVELDTCSGTKSAAGTETVSSGADNGGTDDPSSLVDSAELLCDVCPRCFLEDSRLWCADAECACQCKRADVERRYSEYQDFQNYRDGQLNNPDQITISVMRIETDYDEWLDVWNELTNNK